MPSSSVFLIFTKLEKVNKTIYKRKYLLAQFKAYNSIYKKGITKLYFAIFQIF